MPTEVALKLVEAGYGPPWTIVSLTSTPAIQPNSNYTLLQMFFQRIIIDLLFDDNFQPYTGGDSRIHDHAAIRITGTPKAPVLPSWVSAGCLA